MYDLGVHYHKAAASFPYANLYPKDNNMDERLSIRDELKITPQTYIP
jgi:hypothetical protein